MARNKQERKQPERNEDLPGYPHYPADEDITLPENNSGKLEIKEDSLRRGEPVQSNNTNSSPGENVNTTASSDNLNADNDDEVTIVMGTEADVTDEDLQLFGAIDGDSSLLDSTDDEGAPLNEGDDLDVPGSEDDDANESIGEEDEENNYYSLGGDDKENLTEGNP
jgi:hypothetical protein